MNLGCINLPTGSVWLPFLLAVAVDAQSQPTWRRTYGGYGTDEAKAVVVTTDDRLVLLGSTGSFGSGGESYVIKVSPEGLLEWSHAFGGLGVQASVAGTATMDGLVVAGITSTGVHGGYDILLTGIHNDGTVLWNQEIGSSDWDFCYDVSARTDGYIIAGSTYGFGSVDGDALLVRTDAVGDTLWTKRFGGPGLDEALGVFVDDSDHIVVCGRVDAGTLSEDAFIAKYDDSGDLLWFKRFGGDSADYACGLALAPNGDYLVVGGTNSYSTVPQVLIARFSMDGDSIWQREYGTLGETRMRRIVKRTVQGGYAMVGFNTVFNAGGKDMFMILVDEDGYWELGKNYGGIGDEEGAGLASLTDGGYILAGWSENYGPGLRAVYAVRCAADAETADDTVYPMLDPLKVSEQHAIGSPLLIVPNPSSGEFSLCGADVVAFDVLQSDGRMMLTAVLSHGEKIVKSELPSGSYMVRGYLRDGAIVIARLLIVAP